MAEMRFDFQCPWCGADSHLRGSEKTAFRAQLPCELCSRDMVVSYDCGMVVTRRADGPLTKGREETVRIRSARAG
jgi:hypothetical protein